MARTIINIKNGVTRHPAYRLAAPLNFTLAQGEHLAICGPNGGGKSLFVDVLSGAHPLLGDAMHYDFGSALSSRASDNIRLITFRDVYGGSEPAYYQQRWNQADEQTFPTVGDVLREAQQQLHCTADDASQQLMHEIGIDEHWHKPINLLSSGELRRLQLAKMLLTHPQVLIIDNPYIGLDVEARAMLTRLLTRLAEQITVVVVVSRAEDVPAFITTVVKVSGNMVGEKMPLATYVAEEQAVRNEKCEPQLPKPSAEAVELTSAIEDAEALTSVIDFRNITISYGVRTILRDLTWQVRKGEHWALMGENGAGKSTLLSLVCADNPQGYACNISLFGHRRGRGESIWDIKRRIGYVSPEIFSTYRKALPAIDIVASGLHDTIGLYKRATPHEREQCLTWFAAFEAEHLAMRDYLTLSSGEQRLILLIRAFVKNPDLLILDEPFHGLDTHRRTLARAIIDAYMANPAKTLIMVTHYEEELPTCIDHKLRLIKNK